MRSLKAREDSKECAVEFACLGSLRSTELLIRLIIALVEGAEAKKMLEINLNSRISSPKP